jgi:FdhD protein
MKDVSVVRVRGGGRADDAATEEPLEVRLHGKSFAVIMRTPGADRELAAGFLLSEQVLVSGDDLGTIQHCRDTSRAALDPDAAGHRVEDSGSVNAAVESAANVVNVTLTGRSLAGLDRLLSERRQTMTNSSCGLCGRLTIESLQTGAPPLVAAGRVSAATIASLPDRLRGAQTVFDQTGGLHAAGLFAHDGTLVTTAEDVGRHNAVDKVIGRMVLRDELPLSGCLLFVSGRTSFEIVQKALLGGIPIVASVSAPSSLAIDLARESCMTLIGFVRGDSFNIYTHPERID